MQRRRYGRNQRKNCVEYPAEQIYHRLPTKPPSSPPDDCGGGVLYCTMTLMLFDEFASKGCRSGEILVIVGESPAGHQ